MNNILTAMRMHSGHNIDIVFVGAAAAALGAGLVISAILSLIQKSRYMVVTATVTEIQGDSENYNEAIAGEMCVEYVLNGVTCTGTVVKNYHYSTGDTLPLLLNKKAFELTDDKAASRTNSITLETIIFIVLAIAFVAVAVVLERTGYSKAKIAAAMYMVAAVFVLIDMAIKFAEIIYNKMTHTVKADGKVVRGDTGEEYHRVSNTFKKFSGNSRNTNVYYKKFKFYNIYEYMYGGKTYMTKDLTGTYKLSNKRSEYIYINRKTGKMVRKSEVKWQVLKCVGLLLAAAALAAVSVIYSSYALTGSILNIKIT